MSWSGSKIRQYDLSKVLSFKSDHKIIPKSASQCKYYSYSDSNFAILKDEHTILGVQTKVGSKVIIRESLLDPYLGHMSYSGNTHWTNTLYVDEDKDLLLSGNEHGKLLQFNLTNGKLVKNYGNLGVGYVVYYAKIGNLIFFGGWNSHFRLVLIDQRRTFGEPFKTSIRYHLSMNLCIIPAQIPSKKPIIYLTSSGQNCVYTKDLSDVWEVTDLIDQFYIKVENKFQNNI